MRNRRSSENAVFAAALLVFSVMFWCPGHAEVPPSSVYSNGIFVEQNTLSTNGLSTCQSENGIFTCTFEIGEAGCSVRQLKNFRFYEKGSFRFSLANAPGSGISLSNAGFVVFSESEEYNEADATLHCYSQNGIKTLTRPFENSPLFGFSPLGNLLGVGGNDNLNIIELSSGVVTEYPCVQLWQFAISANESYVVASGENQLVLFSNGKQTGSVATGMFYTRKISVSPDNKSVTVIDKNNVRVYSLPDLAPLFHDALPAGFSFRDVRIDGPTLWTGVNFRDETSSNGYIKTYDLRTGSSTLELKSPGARIRDRTSSAVSKNVAKTVTAYTQIPWPFSPQNQPHVIWNNYEGLNTATDGDTAGAYLHQGVDMHCPAYTQVYAVANGIVKCRLTFASNPAIYWRIATSETQNSGWSTGWLYAHLVESTIQFDIGDTVRIGDYIAQIVPWDNVGGHIHFARIRDTGTVWTYAAPANEWGIVYNPELSLTPMGDTKAPIIIQARTGISKFAYCTNETFTYLAPASLTGDIDIIVKCFDTIGTSEFRQPAFAIYYWIKRRDNGQMIKDTTRGEWRNHYYPMYETTEHHPWAMMQYKVDRTTFPPGGWFNRTRTFAHVITNRSGDSIITLGGRDSSLHTNSFARTWHRLFVKVCDASGNCTVDSEDVYFSAGVGVADAEPTPQELQPMQIVSGSSFSGLKISYALAPDAGSFSLRFYDLAGNEVAILARGEGWTGTHTIFWNGRDRSGRPLGYGTYLCVLKTNKLTAAKKIAYCR